MPSVLVKPTKAYILHCPTIKSPMNISLLLYCMHTHLPLMHIYVLYNFQVVMSLPAMSLGLRFCTSRKGGTGGDGQVLTLGPGNMAAS